MAAAQSAQPDLPKHMSKPSLNRSYASLRTIGALMLREMSTRFGRTPGGYIWAILQPLGQILLLGFAFSLLARSPALGTSFIMFKATGILVFQLFRQCAQHTAKCINFSRPLLQYPRVTWADALLARFLINSFIMTIVTALILTGVIVVQGLQLILDWGSIVTGIMLSLLLALGFGSLNAFLFERVKIWEKIWQILSAPLMISSGVLILYQDLPTSAQNVLWYNPILHVVAIMRMGFYSNYEPQYISISFVCVCAMVPLVMGLLLLRRTHRELIMN